jgi:hypothetical protein
MGGTTADHKEWFSRAFVMAVAASAGYSVQPIQDDVDGVDVVVRHGGITVDVQLKATAVPSYGRNGLLFDLDVKTYDKLRTNRNSPGYLVVAVLPEEGMAWIDHRANHMQMHRLAYWLDITGMSPTPNRATISLTIPLANRVTEEALVAIMTDARTRVMTQ